MVNDSGITPVVLLSKCDLLPEAEIDKARAQVLDLSTDTTVLAFSNVSRKNIDSITGSLERGSTYCLLGSSGVGKTTLLNRLVGNEAFETRPVSKIQNKGRHTTTTRQLVLLENGAMIIDTPGMRELGGIFNDDGLDDTFSEIRELSRQCKFSDCSHTREKGCAILSAMETGRLAEERYRNYLKMKKESEFNRMSYQEKRKKDRRFGKMVKSVMENKRR
jgi:ribosome biogenesis GTPase